jgi:hypothetical protein
MPIPLRADFDAARLRAVARESRDAGQTRRLLALAAIYDGASRTEAAKIGGVTLQIVRDWVLKLNQHGPDGLIDRKRRVSPPPRRHAPRRPGGNHRERPDPGGARPGALAHHRSLPVAVGEFRVSVAKQTLGRELRAMGYRKPSARPRHHAQAEGAIEAFKTASRPVWTRSRAAKALLSMP